MFRKVLFWSHLACGLCAGIVVFIMSITGVMLTYEKQLLAWVDRNAAQIQPPPTAASVNVSTALRSVRARFPDRIPTTLTRRADPRAPITVTLDGGQIVLVHPYAGTVIGEAPSAMRTVFRTATEWHRYLAGTGEYRAIGKAITGGCNLMFLFLVLSGIYLWMPRRWSRAAIASIVLPRWRHSTGKARHFNWHNALGFWSAVPLAIVVASATVISYPWASDLVYRLVGEAPPPRATAPAASRGASGARAGHSTELEMLDEAWHAAERQMPDWKAIALRLPTQAAAPFVFTVDQGWPGQPQKRATLTIDAGTAGVVRLETFDDLSRGRQWRSLLRFAHTGELLGPPGQTVAGVASAAACVLVYSGFSLALRRFMSWRARVHKWTDDVAPEKPSYPLYPLYPSYPPSTPSVPSAPSEGII
jgi:uncharacterized iron-regulated membrane protein